MTVDVTGELEKAELGGSLAKKSVTPKAGKARFAVDNPTLSWPNSALTKACAGRRHRSSKAARMTGLQPGDVIKAGQRRVENAVDLAVRRRDAGVRSGRRAFACGERGRERFIQIGFAKD